MLILMLVGYNLLAEGLRRWLPWSHFVLGIAGLDLLAIGIVYFLRAEPGGPLFLLFCLTITCAAATLTVGLSLLYTTIVIGAVAALELTFISPAIALVRQYHIESRLTFLALLGMGMTVLYRSLILQQQAFQSVRDEAQRLSQLDEMREEFVATISHDLRTPLTAARASLGMLSLSAGAQLRSDENELLENARRNIERLHLLINDLLAFNQLAVGTFQLERQTVNLVDDTHYLKVYIQRLRQKPGDDADG
jgi:signal transduction histidine kinase